MSITPPLPQTVTWLADTAVPFDGDWVFDGSADRVTLNGAKLETNPQHAVTIERLNAKGQIISTRLQGVEVTKHGDHEIYNFAYGSTVQLDLDHNQQYDSSYAQDSGDADPLDANGRIILNTKTNSYTLSTLPDSIQDYTSAFSLRCWKCADDALQNLEDTRRFIDTHSRSGQLDTNGDGQRDYLSEHVFHTSEDPDPGTGEPIKYYKREVYLAPTEVH